MITSTSKLCILNGLPLKSSPHQNINDRHLVSGSWQVPPDVSNLVIISTCGLDGAAEMLGFRLEQVLAGSEIQRFLFFFSVTVSQSRHGLSLSLF